MNLLPLETRDQLQDLHSDIPMYQRMEEAVVNFLENHGHLTHVQQYLGEMPLGNTKKKVYFHLVTTTREDF